MTAMKKSILMIALALLASASFSTVSAGKKKDKKAEQTPVVQPVQLKDGSDTLSYLAGMYMTEGLIPYIQQLGVDTAYMAEFVDGFKKAVSDMTPQQKAYITGMKIADQVRDGMLPRMQKDLAGAPDSLISDVLFRGFVDAVTNDSTVISQKKAVEAFKVKQAWNKTEREERLYGPNRDAGRHYLDSLKADSTIIRTESGLMYKVLTQGEGEVPQRTDKVLVNYEGRLVDGTVFDASAKHGDKPASFRADQVISGWTEALTRMPVGSKWQLYIPYELAYGSRNMGNIKPFSALIFDVELVGIDKPKTEQTDGEKAATKQSVKKSVGKKASKK